MLRYNPMVNHWLEYNYRSSKLLNPANKPSGKAVNRLPPKSSCRKLLRPSKSPAFKLVKLSPVRFSIPVTLAKSTAAQSLLESAFKMASSTAPVRAHMLVERPLKRPF